MNATGLYTDMLTGKTSVICDNISIPVADFLSDPVTTADDKEKIKTALFPKAALQAPISAPRYKVIYIAGGKERQSAWLYSEVHAQQGLAMMKAKYGEKNAIIYVD